MSEPVIGHVAPAAVLPAECEGELNQLLRAMRGNGTSFSALPSLDAADRLEAIIDRYSGVRRTDVWKR